MYYSENIKHYNENYYYVILLGIMHYPISPTPSSVAIVRRRRRHHNHSHHNHHHDHNHDHDHNHNHNQTTTTNGNISIPMFLKSQSTALLLSPLKYLHKASILPYIYGKYVKNTNIDESYIIYAGYSRW